MEVSAPKARTTFWGVIRENSLVFLLNNALVYMFFRIQSEILRKECIWVRIRVAIFAKKGALKLNLPYHLPYPVISHPAVTGKLLYVAFCNRIFNFSLVLCFYGMASG